MTDVTEDQALTYYDATGSAECSIIPPCGMSCTDEVFGKGKVTRPP